jgi:hypothetical protein
VDDDCPQPSPQVCIVPLEFDRPLFGADPEMTHPSLKIFAQFVKSQATSIAKHQATTQAGHFK